MVCKPKLHQPTIRVTVRRRSFHSLTSKEIALFLWLGRTWKSHRVHVSCVTKRPCDCGWVLLAWTWTSSFPLPERDLYRAWSSLCVFESFCINHSCWLVENMVVFFFNEWPIVSKFIWILYFKFKWSCRIVYADTISAFHKVCVNGCSELSKFIIIKHLQMATKESG